MHKYFLDLKHEPSSEVHYGRFTCVVEPNLNYCRDHGKGN
jgi:hypothetical protein